MDVGKSLRFIFEDKQWPSKVLIGSLILLVSLPLTFVSGRLSGPGHRRRLQPGRAAQRARRLDPAAAGVARPVGRVAGGGAEAAADPVVWSLPLIVLNMPSPASASSLLDSGSGLLTLFGGMTVAVARLPGAAVGHRGGAGDPGHLPAPGRNARAEQRLPVQRDLRLDPRPDRRRGDCRAAVGAAQHWRCCWWARGGRPAVRRGPGPDAAGGGHAEHIGNRASLRPDRAWQAAPAARQRSPRRPPRRLGGSQSKETTMVVEPDGTITVTPKADK
jgi:hypothetical protein